MERVREAYGKCKVSEGCGSVREGCGLHSHQPKSVWEGYRNVRLEYK